MLKILLIEDDLIVQYVEKIMLEKLGHHVDVATTGSQALEMANGSDAYDIIFADIGLPDMSGCDVIRIINQRNTAINKSIPIIVITGYSGDEEKQTYLNAGACEVITKPVVINTLKKLLDEHAKKLNCSESEV